MTSMAKDEHVHRNADRARATLDANRAAVSTFGRLALGLGLGTGPVEVAQFLAAVMFNDAEPDHGPMATNLDVAATCRELAATLLEEADICARLARRQGATYEQIGTAL